MSKIYYNKFSTYNKNDLSRSFLNLKNNFNFLNLKKSQIYMKFLRDFFRRINYLLKILSRHVYNFFKKVIKDKKIIFFLLSILYKILEFIGSPNFLRKFKKLDKNRKLLVFNRFLKKRSSSFVSFKFFNKKKISILSKSKYINIMKYKIISRGLTLAKNLGISPKNLFYLMNNILSKNIYHYFLHRSSRSKISKLIRIYKIKIK